MTAINLINLLGLSKGDWAAQVSTPPTPLANFVVTISQPQGQVGHIWLASPDGRDPALRAIPFTQSGDSVTINVPSLAYWDLILIDWSK